MIPDPHSSPGHQRSADEYHHLLDVTGYRVEQVIRSPATGYPWSIIVARPPER